MRPRAAGASEAGPGVPGSRVGAGSIRAMAAPPGTWLDPRPLQRDWPEPVPPLRVPRWLALGVPLLVLLLALALVVGLGGFERRGDRVTVMAPGAELDAKQLVYTFDAATVQRTQGYDGSWQQLVTVRGTVRNPTDEPQAPKYGDFGSFVLRGLPGPHVAVMHGFALDGAYDDYVPARRSHVAPGLPALPIEVRFVMPDDYRPSDVVLLGVFVMEYEDQYVLGLGGGEPSWGKSDDALGVYLPVTVLPEESS